MLTTIVAIAVTGLFVAGAVQRLRGDAWGSPIARYAAQHGGHRDRAECYLVRRGVSVRLRVVRLADGKYAPSGTEVSAGVLVPTGLRMLRRHEWSYAVPSLLGDLRSASEKPVELADLEPAWGVLRRVDGVVLGASGRHVVARIVGIAESPVLLDAMVDAVVAVARWDDGLLSRLLDLRGAHHLDDHELAPAVMLEPDDLVIGVRDGTALLAQLDAARGDASATVSAGHVTLDAGDLPADCLAALARCGDGTLVAGANGARFTWTTTERDPGRLRAAVDALRALAASSPYR